MPEAHSLSWYDAARTAVVYNPNAGGGFVGRRWTRLEPELRAALGDVRFLATAGPGGGEVRAREAVQAGVHTVLSLGGDGTHNEVINGILTTGAAPGSISFGVLPAGTGGDFRRILSNSGDLMEAARSIPSGQRCPVDAGRIEFGPAGAKQVRHFINICSFGVGGLACRMVNESSKFISGRVPFYVGTLRAILAYRPALVRLKVDGTDVGTFRVTNIAVANGRFFGGGMMIAPEARLSDGMFDVVVVEDVGLWDVIRFTSTIYRGRHVGLRGIHTFRGSHVEAEALENDAYIDLDGEAPGLVPIDLKVVPGAVRLIQPRPDVL